MLNCFLGQEEISLELNKNWQKKLDTRLSHRYPASTPKKNQKITCTSFWLTILCQFFPPGEYQDRHNHELTDDHPSYFRPALCGFKDPTTG